LNPGEIPGGVVNKHGAFAWGNGCGKAVPHAVVLEEVAKMAFRTLMLNPEAEMGKTLLDKHFLRKHGKNAYYGQ